MRSYQSAGNSRFFFYTELPTFPGGIFRVVLVFSVSHPFRVSNKSVSYMGTIGRKNERINKASSSYVLGGAAKNASVLEMSSILSQPNVNRPFSIFKIYFQHVLHFYHAIQPTRYTFVDHKRLYNLISPTSFDFGHLQGYNLILRKDDFYCCAVHVFMIISFIRTHAHFYTL
jgi:hypothetical protein